MSTIKQISGGICAPKGFCAAGVHCGISKNPLKKDLALIFSAERASAAAVYTRNLVKAAPVLVTMENLQDGYAQAILCNSGNANACAEGGEATAREMCALAAGELHIPAQDVIVASTGVIGQPLPLEPIRDSVWRLTRSLSADGGADAEQAIMTTDLMPKEVAVSFTINGTPCVIGGIAKGSGMIHPNMATMLAFLTTDAAISRELLQKALATVVNDTFNMISVDGDTSTNDMAAILANGLAGNAPVEAEGAAFDSFVSALSHVCIYLARMIARDGEGASKLLECYVTGAADDASAKKLAKSVIGSSLFKAAMFGADANWGRALCALGYAGVAFDVQNVLIAFQSRAGKILVCERGCGVPFDEEKAKKILMEDMIEILIGLSQGDGEAIAWGCDLTYDYVRINGDYRS